MNADSITTADLEAYLDEALPSADMAHIEAELRGDPELLRQLALINARRDAGVHTLGEIWRRHRIGCPSREQLGSYLLSALAPELAAYVRLHLETTGCRVCQSNLADLRDLQQAAHDQTVTRRRRYFQSSAGLLKKK